MLLTSSSACAAASAFACSAASCFRRAAPTAAMSATLAYSMLRVPASTSSTCSRAGYCEENLQQFASGWDVSEANAAVLTNMYI
jgi:hypothetical protein